MNVVTKFDRDIAIGGVQNIAKKKGIGNEFMQEYANRSFIIQDNITSLDKRVQEVFIQYRASIFSIGDYIFLPIGGLDGTLAHMNVLKLLISQKVISANYEESKTLNLSTIPYFSIEVTQEDREYNHIDRSFPDAFFGYDKRVIIFLEKQIGGIQRIMELV